VAELSVTPAGELAPAEELWQIMQRVRELHGRICMDYVAIGALLAHVQDTGLHAHAGEHIKSFDQFLVEVGLRRSSAYNCIAVYRRFGDLPHLLEGIAMDRLVKLLPVKMEEEERAIWLEKARELPASGLRDEIREARGERPVDVCEHDRQKTFYRCEDCGLTSDRPLY
jgi:hypothetical protein